MGPDGQLVVDEGTLTVQAQPEEVTRRNVVSELPMLNSQSYALNRAPSERWSPEETENFYAASALCSFIYYLFFSKMKTIKRP